MSFVNSKFKNKLCKALNLSLPYELQRSNHQLCYVLISTLWVTIFMLAFAPKDCVKRFVGSDFVQRKESIPFPKTRHLI